MERRLTKHTRQVLIFCFFLFINLIILVPKGEFVIWFNDTYSISSVLFFRAVNLFGDGLMFAIYLPVLLFHKFRRAIYFSFLIIVQTVVVHLFKSGIADGYPRPVAFFEQLGTDLMIGPGVNIHFSDSFPSGHATTAFTLGIFLMMLNKRTVYQLSIFFVAMLAAFARVYLAQHFFIDVAAGFFASLLTFYTVDYMYVRLKLYRVKGSLTQVLFPEWQPQWLTSRRYQEFQQFF